MTRMKAIGHGVHEKMTAEQALEAANQATPGDVTQMPFVNEHGIDLGSEVTITADNFGLEPTQGTLVAATKTRLILRREDQRTGVVHVHFSSNRFIFKKVKSCFAIWKIKRLF